HHAPRTRRGMGLPDAAEPHRHGGVRRLLGTDHDRRQRGARRHHRPLGPVVRRPVRGGILPHVLRLAHLYRRIHLSLRCSRADPWRALGVASESRMMRRVVLSVALLVGLVLFVNLRSHGAPMPLRKPLDTFQPVLAGWQPRESSLFTDDIQNVLRTSDYVMRRYTDEV